MATAHPVETHTHDHAATPAEETHLKTIRFNPRHSAETESKDWLENRRSLRAHILVDVEKETAHHSKKAKSYESLFVMGNWIYIPPGLEVLREYQKIQVKQVVEGRTSGVAKDVDMTGMNRRNSYNVFDEFQNRILHVSEVTDVELMRKGNKRKYIFSLRDSLGQEILKVRRHRSCCIDAIECMIADGTVIGGVKAGCSCFCITTYLNVFEGALPAKGPTVLLIEDKGWCNNEFAVVDPHDKTQVVAYIAKRFEDDSVAVKRKDSADVFLLEFQGSHEVDPIHKAILIGSIFFLDVMHFSDSRTKREVQATRRATKMSLKK